MKSKKLVIFIGLTVLVVGYAIFDFQSEKKQEEIKTQQSKVVHIEPDDLVEMSIQKTSGNIVLQKDDQGTWSITEPIKEVADQNAAKQFTSELTQDQSSAVIEKNVELKNFGLEQPKATFILKTKDGQQTKIALAEMKNFEGDSFIRLNEDMKVLVSAAQWHNKADKTLFDFRDKRLFRLSLADIIKIEVKNPNGNFLLEQKSEQKDTQWTVAKNPTWKLDQNKVRELMTSLNTTTATAFLEKSKMLSGNKVQVGVFLKDGKKWLAEMVSADNHYVVQTSDPQLTFQISKPDGERFISAEATDYRDRKEPFQFEKASVAEVNLQLSGQSYVMKKEGNDWKLVSSSEQLGAKEFNSKKLLDVIDELRNLQTFEFEGQKNVAQPIRQSVVLKNAEGAEVFKLLIGAVEKRKISGSESQIMLAKSSLYPETISLRAADVTDLALEQIVAEKSKEKSAEEKNFENQMQQPPVEEIQQ